jgi:hypothetical protein
MRSAFSTSLIAAASASLSVMPNSSRAARLDDGPSRVAKLVGGGVGVPERAAPSPACGQLRRG